MRLRLKDEYARRRGTASAIGILQIHQPELEYGFTGGEIYDFLAKSPQKMRDVLGERSALNPQLVRCLLAAIVVGFAAAGWALSSGWHPALAVLVYCLSGSFVLVALTLATAVHQALRPADSAVRLHALPAPQST